MCENLGIRSSSACRCDQHGHRRLDCSCILLYMYIISNITIQILPVAFKEKILCIQNLSNNVIIYNHWLATVDQYSFAVYCKKLEKCWYPTKKHKTMMHERIMRYIFSCFLNTVFIVDFDRNM
jgi:hypothetical protein